jgi:transposase
VPPKEIRGLRDLVRLRAYLVVERTRFKNKIRAGLAKRGIHVFRNPFTMKGGSSLKGLGIKLVDGCLAIISALGSRIRKLSAEIERKAVENEDAKLLMSILALATSRLCHTG